MSNLRGSTSNSLSESNNNNGGQGGNGPNTLGTHTNTYTSPQTSTPIATKTTNTSTMSMMTSNLNSLAQYFNSRDELQLSGFTSDSELDETHTPRTKYTDPELDSSNSMATGGAGTGTGPKPERLLEHLVQEDGGGRGHKNDSDEYGSSSSTDSVSVSKIAPKSHSENNQQLVPFQSCTPKSNQAHDKSLMQFSPRSPSSPFLGIKGISSTSPPWKNTLGTGQVFTRAPNFRTPGGYKPPLKEKEPRNLTTEQILAEVRDMYANPDKKDEPDLEQQIKTSVDSPKPNKKTPERPTPKFDESFKGKAGASKVTEIDLTRKEKLSSFLNSDDIWGNGASASGGKDKEKKSSPKPTKSGNDKVEVEEPLIARSRSYLCYSDDENPGSGQSKELGVLPYRYSDLCTGVPKNFSKQNSPLYPPTTKQSNMIELDKLWKDIQDTKLKLKNEMESLHKNEPQPADSKNQDGSELPSFASSSGPSPRRPSLGKRALTPPTKFIEPLPLSPTLTKNSPEPSTKPKKNYRKSNTSRPRTAKGLRRTQHKSTSFDIFGPSQRTSNSLVPIGMGSGDGDDMQMPRELFNIELATLLKDTDLDESDLDEIISELSAEFHNPSGDSARRGGIDEKEADLELSKALQQLKISEWAKSGADDYSQKFYQEKFKRQHCEKEIQSLQKDLLETKEKVAVLEGVLKSKENTIKKYGLQCETLLLQFRAYEKRTRTITTQLQIQNTNLISETETNRLRISQYEKELGKALQLSTDFKEKMDNILEDMERDKEDWNEEREELKGKLSKLEMEFGNEKATKESTLRALNESQKNLDESQKLLEQKSTEVTKLSRTLNLSSTTLAQAVGEKEEAERKLRLLTEEKQILETENKELGLKLEVAEKEKIVLETKYKSKLMDDAEKFHNYYNSKMQEILQRESEKMIHAEREFMQSYENKLKSIETLAESHLNDLKEKHSTEMSLLKTRYETQIEGLKKENEEKGRVLGTVSRQLLCYSGEPNGISRSFENSSKGTELVTENVISTKNVTREYGTSTSTKIDFSKYLSTLLQNQAQALSSTSSGGKKTYNVPSILMQPNYEEQDNK